MQTSLGKTQNYQLTLPPSRWVGWYLTVVQRRGIRVAQMFIIEWSGWRPDTTLLNVIDAAADKAELPSLMRYTLGGSLCWRLGLLPRYCDCNESRHGTLIPPHPWKER